LLLNFPRKGLGVFSKSQTRIYVSSLFLICTLITFELQANVFTSIDRRIRQTTPNSVTQKIGLIEINTPGEKLSRCTGSLVGPDMVLTNQHCVRDFEPLNLKPSAYISFSAFYDNGSSLGTSVVDEIYSIKRMLTNPARVEFNNAKEDWAILILHNPLGETLGWFSVAPQTTSEKNTDALSIPVSLGGYFMDKEDAWIKRHRKSKGPWRKIDQSESLYLQSNCKIRDIFEGTVEHDCSESPGASGSPLFEETAAGPQILALNAAHDVPDAIEEQNFQVYYVLKKYNADYTNWAIDTKYFYGAVQDLLKTYSRRKTN
jgi:V8-like Glu-specific endopeptidase